MSDVFRELDYCLNLGTVKAIEPFHNVVDACARLHVFQDSRDRHTSAAKHPGTAHNIGDAFDFRAICPVDVRHFESTLPTLISL
jgi:hypothetical protein